MRKGNLKKNHFPRTRASEGTEKKVLGAMLGQEKNPSSLGRPPLQVASAEGVSEAPSPSGKILICITGDATRKCKFDSHLQEGNMT